MERNVYFKCCTNFFMIFYALNQYTFGDKLVYNDVIGRTGKETTLRPNTSISMNKGGYYFETLEKQLGMYPVYRRIAQCDGVWKWRRPIRGA